MSLLRILTCFGGCSPGDTSWPTAGRWTQHCLPKIVPCRHAMRQAGHVRFPGLSPARHFGSSGALGRALRNPATRSWLATLRSLCAFAIKRGWLKSDPTANIKLRAIKGDGFHCWMALNGATLTSRVSMPHSIFFSTNELEEPRRSGKCRSPQAACGARAGLGALRALFLSIVKIPTAEQGTGATFVGRGSHGDGFRDLREASALRTGYADRHV